MRNHPIISDPSCLRQTSLLLKKGCVHQKLEYNVWPLRFRPFFQFVTRRTTEGPLGASRIRINSNASNRECPHSDEDPSHYI